MGMIWVGYRRPVDEATALVETEEGMLSLLESDTEDTLVDLDKAWHGIHWLLTRSPDATDDITSEAIFANRSVATDLDHGPAGLLDPERVRAVEAALAALPVAELASRVDLRAMAVADVYPNIWDESDVFDEYLAPAYDQLRAFYADAARAGDAVIQTIT